MPGRHVLMDGAAAAPEAGFLQTSGEQERLCSMGVSAMLPAMCIFAKTRSQLNHRITAITTHNGPDREIWDETTGSQDASQPHRCVVVQRCATPSRPPSADSSGTASSSTAASPAWPRSSCCPHLGLQFFGCRKNMFVNTSDVRQTRLWCLDLLS